MIFIGGMHRSGTSLVHFLVGAHPQCIAVGEVWSLIAHPDAIAAADTTWCSCGEHIATCTFWGPLLPRLDGSGDYAPFLEHFRDRYPDRTYVDSSKHLEAIGRSRPAKVLYVMRDVRGWSDSTQRSGVRAFLSWKRSNERQMEYLRREEIDWLRVSYDELGLRPEASLRRITTFLGLPYTDQMMRYGDVEHHAVHTDMKRDPHKMAGVTYDYRWIQSARGQISAALLPGVMRFNRDHVYGTLDEVWSRR